MFKKWFIVLVVTMLGRSVEAQTNPIDSAMAREVQELMADTTIDYEELFQDFEAFMDSILMPQSYFMPSLSIGRGYFNFTSKRSDLLETTPKLTYSPMLTWYHKTGIGLSMTGYMIHDEQNMNMYNCENGTACKPRLMFKMQVWQNQ